MARRGRKPLLAAGSLEKIEELTDEQKLDRLEQAFYKALSPPARLSLSQWADDHRWLPRETSSEYGPWRTSRFPFLKRIMDCLSPQSKARKIIVAKGAQLGFTEIHINWIMYVADHMPAPSVYIQGTLEAVKDFNIEKLQPSIKATNKVATSLGESKAVELSDSALKKAFPGGFWAMGGANSDKFLRGKSIQNAGIDEEDSYKAGISDQGSPIAMLRKRLANFPQSKEFRTSTPTIKETSTIWPAFEAGSMEYFYLPCPFCNPENGRHEALFVLTWDQIKYSDTIDPVTNLPTDVWCECPHCGGIIDEYQKTWMLENGRWLSSKGNEDGELYEVGDVEYPSFHISSFYSPFGFFSWRDAVAEFFEYKRTRDKNLLQVFENQTCGLPYSLTGQDVSSTWAESHKEDYVDPGTGEIFDVPLGGLALTAGVDIQADRIECEVVAWGLGGESWSVDYAVFWGATDYLGNRFGVDENTGQPTVWKQLDDYLGRTWNHASGSRMPVECTCIDSGYRSEPVHIFCRLREGRRIFPVKGRAGLASGHIQRPKRRHERFATWQFIVFVDEVKDKVYQSLMVEAPGPGYSHFPNKDVYNRQYFEGLTAENREIKIVRGQKILVWNCPDGARNEPLDCRVYALAALQVYAPNLDVRAQRRDPIKPDSGPSIGQENYVPQQSARAAPARRKRGSRGVEV